MLDVAAVHLATTYNLVVGLFVNEHGREVITRLTVGARGHSVGHADAMFVVQHVVESKFSSQHLVLVIVVHQTVLLIMALQVGILSAVVGLTAAAVLVFRHTEDVKSTRAIVQVQLLQTIDIVVHASHRATVETETLTNGTNGFDTDDSLDSSIVFSSRCHNHIYVFYLIAAQLIELTGVAHLSSIDINKRFSTSYNFNIFTITKYTWNLAKHIGACSHFSKIASFNGSHKSIVFHSNERTLTFYFHTVQFVTIGMHSDGSNVIFIA